MMRVYFEISTSKSNAVWHTVIDVPQPGIYLAINPLSHTVHGEPFRSGRCENCGLPHRYPDDGHD